MKQVRDYHDAPELVSYDRVVLMGVAERDLFFAFTCSTTKHLNAPPLSCLDTIASEIPDRLLVVPHRPVSSAPVTQSRSRAIRQRLLCCGSLPQGRVLATVLQRVVPRSTIIPVRLRGGRSQTAPYGDRLGQRPQPEAHILRRAPSR
jgi:hypothetical protein